MLFSFVIFLLVINMFICDLIIIWLEVVLFLKVLFNVFCMWLKNCCVFCFLILCRYKINCLVLNCFKILLLWVIFWSVCVICCNIKLFFVDFIFCVILCRLLMLNIVMVMVWFFFGVLSLLMWVIVEFVLSSRVMGLMVLCVRCFLWSM